MPLVRSPPLLVGHMQPPGDDVRAAAEGMAPKVANRLLAIWAEAAASPEHAVRMLRDSAKSVIPPLIDAWGGGRAAIGEPLGLIQKDFKVEFVFDRLAPQNLEAVEDWSARFVREISDDVRTTIHDTMVDAVKDGLGPEETARNLRESIGLTASQARAVRNYRGALARSDMGALRYNLRDRRFDETTQGAFQSGRPLTPDQVDERVTAYRRRYLSYRANTIARYETLYASNAGAASAIRAAAPGGARKRWLLAYDERVCPRCRSVVELQPDGVDVDRKFRWAHGAQSGEIDFPPLHPDCRCTVTYRVL